MERLRHADAGQNLLRRRRDDSARVVDDQQISRRRFEHVALLVEHQGAGVRVDVAGLQVGEIIMHAAAALQFARQRVRRHLANLRHRERLPNAIFFSEQAERQRVSVHCDQRPASGWCHRRIRPRRREEAEAEIVAVGQERVVAVGQIAGRLRQFFQRKRQRNLGDFKRIGEARKVFVHAEQPPAESSQLLGDCRPEDETSVPHGNRQLFCGQELAVAIRERLRHTPNGTHDDGERQGIVNGRWSLVTSH